MLLALLITAAAIRAHMQFLASDLLEGRETGTRGYEVAAAYVADQFHAAGLETRYQPIAFRTARVDYDKSSVTVAGLALAPHKDFALRGDPMHDTLDVEAPVVFAGFGIVAPGRKHDDYAGVDVRGKIVMLLSGAPSTFPTDQRAYYSSFDLKRRNAESRGAAGILAILTRTDERRSPFAKMASRAPGTVMVAVGPDGNPIGGASQLRGAASISWEAAAKLFAHAPMTLDRVLDDAEKGITHSFELGERASMHMVAATGGAASENVIATLRGSDPKLRDEFVVVSAHLDHLGDHPRPNGTDGLYNGALDNASGVAALIEIAKSLAKNPPKRSILFVAFTGEEKGEQGSEFFVHFPPVPRASIVADVNMDMFTMLYPVADVVLLGGEHTTLGPLATRAAHESGFTVSPDPLPEEVRFIRSDQFSFVKAGIPAIHIKAGNKSRDPAIDGAKLTREWMRNVYHSPKDDMSQRLDFASGARAAETNLRLVGMIADAPQRPSWNAGDFFATIDGGRTSVRPAGLKPGLH